MTKKTLSYARKKSLLGKGSDRWANDLYFARQRISCLNNTVITLVREIPAKLPVTNEMLKLLLNDLSIEEAVDQKRLFICDLEILEGIYVKDGFVMCRPIALFFVDNDDNLRPVAIQLFQNPGPTNPIFFPTDHNLTWALVKMWYNNSDAACHQGLSHLGYTHLLMEGVVVNTHRQLAPSHPVFKLLAPHFLFLLAINTRGLELLISEGGWVEKTMNCGVKGLLQLIAKGVSAWRMDVHGTLPEDLKQRGVDDPTVLPGYHFRDDALLHHRCISNYVRSYVNLYYESPEKIRDDCEIQAWINELARPRNGANGGLGLKGVPGGDGLPRVEDLITILTSIIYTCTVSHASTNFPQYDEYGFPPNYPSLLRGYPPTDKSERTEQDIIRALPDRPTTLDIMVVTKILSQRGTKCLGEFEVQYIFDDKACDIVDSFRRDIEEITKEIEHRNTQRNVPYDVLHPYTVPNSISI